MVWKDLARWWNGNKLEQFARQLAAQAVEAVYRSATHQVPGMSSAEAQGYIRARAGVAVRSTARGLGTLPASPTVQARIIDLAIDQVVMLVIKRQTQHRTVAFVRSRAA